MGMYDSFFGGISCPYCKVVESIEIQFKWSSCLLDWYELGDIVDDAPDGLYIEKEEWEVKCNCGEKYTPVVILKNKQVVKFSSLAELDNIDLEKIENIEVNYAKKNEYSSDCLIGIGKSQELTEFEEQPFELSSNVIALGSVWTVKEGYRITINEESDKAYLKALIGCLGRNQNKWFAYKVENPVFGERWLEVEDAANHRSFRKGNMAITNNYDLVEEGYLIEKLF